jgi:hypothetical protein
MKNKKLIKKTLSQPDPIKNKYNIKKKVLIKKKQQTKHYYNKYNKYCFTRKVTVNIRFLLILIFLIYILQKSCLELITQFIFI